MTLFIDIETPPCRVADERLHHSRKTWEWNELGGIVCGARQNMLSCSRIDICGTYIRALNNPGQSLGFAI